jgi:DNA-binding CsgD family transcriptional regulator/tetratricopeptide (TPR) repeat protein
MAGTAERGRAAFERHAWADAHALLGTANLRDPIDHERLAIAAHLLGKDAESDVAWERAHREWLRLGDRERAARCAFWLAFALLLRGEVARASGWLARAERLVEECDRDSAARGLLLVLVFIEAMDDGDHARADALAGEMLETARRCGDQDVLAFGMLGRAEAALALGEIRRGLQQLDEVMVAVTTGEVSPIPTGIIYCAVIEACMNVFDMRRAADWTEALHDWCSAQPDLVPYRGQCLVHRSQVLQAHGAWAEAVAEAERARRRLSDPAHPALGLALYQRGELHRLRGEFADAERAYRAASGQGRDPEPGFALLRLAEGKVEAAASAIGRILDENRGRPDRPAMLAAAVEVLLAAGDIERARAAADELARAAATGGARLLHAVADHALGSVLLAENDVPAALPLLRRACTTWHELGLPYDTARAHVQIALACRARSDHDAAGLELDAARTIFMRLGAAPDLAEVERLAGPSQPPSVLTDRECEVLRLVAAGMTNREIAAALVISPHTVARHLQNIFTKLDLGSRAAATAYAYEHDLV